MQANTITNETMRDIIQALTRTYPASANQQPTIQPGDPVLENKKPAYKPNIKISVKAAADPIVINFCDVSFVSTNTNRIVLPYSGPLPNDLLLSIMNLVIENCFTLRELKELQKHDAWTLNRLTRNIHPTIRIMPSRLRPLIALSFDITAINGSLIAELLPAEAKPQHIADMLNRFFNRKHTGLTPDVCACLEQQHIEYKRRYITTTNKN